NFLEIIISGRKLSPYNSMAALEILTKINAPCNTSAVSLASHAIQYNMPDHWIRYDATAIVQNFVDAKAAILSLRAIPHQRDWVEKLQQLQLKMEVAGTSRIEGAEFTERELDAALDPTRTA